MVEWQFIYFLPDIGNYKHILYNVYNTHYIGICMYIEYFFQFIPESYL